MICFFMMQCFIQAFDLLLFTDSDRYEFIDDLEDQPCHYERVSRRDQCSEQLNQELMYIALDEAADTVDGFLCKNSQQDRSYDAAHAMDAPDIQCVIPVELVFDLYSVIAADSRGQSYQDSCPRSDKSCSRCNSRKSCNSSRQCSNKACILFSDPCSCFKTGNF